MLILKLKKNEKVFIEIAGKTVGLMITGYKEGGYKTAIAAPKEVRIIREGAKNREPIREGSDGLQ